MGQVPMRRDADDKEKRQYQARFEPELWERMTRYKEETGMSYMEQISRGAEMYLNARGAAETPADSLLISLPPDAMQRLEAIAPKMYQRDAARYAEWLLTASSDRTPAEVRAFVFQEEKKENGENGDEKKVPVKAVKAPRKVA